MNDGASDLMNVNEFCHCESRVLACTLRSCRSSTNVRQEERGFRQDECGCESTCSFISGLL